MTESIVKYFTMIFSSLYTYAKLLNLKITAKSIIIDLAFASSLSFSVFYIRLYYPLLTVPLMILFSYIFITIITKTEPGLSITTTIISFGSSYVFFAVSALFVAAILELIDVDSLDENDIISFICIALIQLSLISIPFRFRRLRTGMPFLRRKGGSNLGVFISVVLLCCVIVFSSSSNTDLIYILPAVLIFLSGAFILFWWRSRLKKTYIEKLCTNEIQSLQNTINEKDAQIEHLEQHNDFLAKIIHKDNKLIPTMELAVREYLQPLVQDDNENSQEKGHVLLEQLETIARERYGIIENYQSTGKKLPLTNVFSIDALMTYMLNKADGNGIKFELVVSGSVKYLVENIISETDLNTLLADLVENAIIATASNDRKSILVSISISEGHYLIDVLDSGIPFETETIVNLGLKKITTHADNGGSGIGLTTAFEIFKKYSASFIIEEFPEENILFTKKVSVKFDNLNQYLIKTVRNSEIKAILQRKDLIVMA